MPILKLFLVIMLIRSKIKNKYRWQIIFKCEDDDNLGEILSQAEMTCRKNKEFSDVAIIIDKSPGMIN